MCPWIALEAVFWICRLATFSTAALPIALRFVDLLAAPAAAAVSWFADVTRDDAFLLFIDSFAYVDIPKLTLDDVIGPANWTVVHAWPRTCVPSFIGLFPAGSTAGFRELARFIEGHRSCGALTIHAPDCDSALGFLIALDCECGDRLVRWISVDAAFQEVIDSAWPSTSN